MGAEVERPLILIAERDQQVRRLEQFFLEREGMTVEFADDGQAALASARLTRPAAVVTEILLPRLDGLSLCRQLRDDPLTHDIPVIVFSVLAAATRAAEAGARAFLRKPLVESVLLASLREALAAQSHANKEQSWASR